MTEVTATDHVHLFERRVEVPSELRRQLELQGTG
jgi:hypothetical protein